jgi:hypothetical protein
VQKWVTEIFTHVFVVSTKPMKMKAGFSVLPVTLNSILASPFRVYLLLPQTFESDISA